MSVLARHVVSVAAPSLLQTAQTAHSATVASHRLRRRCRRLEQVAIRTARTPRCVKHAARCLRDTESELFLPFRVQRSRRCLAPPFTPLRGASADKTCRSSRRGKALCLRAHAPRGQRVGSDRRRPCSPRRCSLLSRTAPPHERARARVHEASAWRLWACLLRLWAGVRGGGDGR